MPRTSRDRVVEQLMRDVELGEADRARLVDLHGKLAAQLPQIAQRFFDRLAAGRDPDALPTSSEQDARVCTTFVEWMASGLAGPHDEHFFESRANAASWHVAAGLPQRRVVTAMTMVRGEYHDRIDQLYELREGRLVARSVDKLLDLELALLVHDRVDENAELAARARVAQSDRIAAIQTLSSGLAHEVRNPLNSASLQLELLERRLKRAVADPKLIQPLEQVSHEIERLTRMLNEFLAFARPSPLVLADHDVAAIVGDVVTAQRPFATARGAAIEVAGAGSLRARVDADKLRQIAHNLVRNALEVVAPGGHVVVTIHGDDKHVHLAVEDDGSGISDAIRHRIYEPFFTTKEAGTGLGLSIVHGMVVAHGGAITFDSSPQGTRFHVSLPRRPWLQRSIASA
jgi:signal transduction histidine kinase